MNTVKIAPSFVNGMSTDSTRRVIVKAVISLTRALGLSVVAEGVDTFEQVELLRAMGCQLGQGFLFTRPMPADAIRDFLELDAIERIGRRAAKPDPQQHERPTG